MITASGWMADRKMGDRKMKGGLAARYGVRKLIAAFDFVGGSLAYAGVTIVDGGTLDLLSRLAAAPVVASGQAIGPGAVFNANGTSLYILHAGENETFSYGPSKPEA